MIKRPVLYMYTCKTIHACYWHSTRVHLALTDLDRPQLLHAKKLDAIQLSSWISISSKPPSVDAAPFGVVDESHKPEKMRRGR